MLGQDGYVGEQNLTRSSDHYESSDRPLIQKDNLMLGVRIVHPIGALLDVVLHSNEDFSLGIVPGQDGEFVAPRAGVNFEQERFVAGFYGAKAYARGINGHLRYTEIGRISRISGLDNKATRLFPCGATGARPLYGEQNQQVSATCGPGASERNVFARAGANYKASITDSTNGAPALSAKEKKGAITLDRSFKTWTAGFSATGEVCRELSRILFQSRFARASISASCSILTAR
jgi:hypothetical protein